MQRAGSRKDSNLLPAVQDIRGTPEVGFIWDNARRGVSDAGVERAVRTCGLFIGKLLEVVRKNDRRR